MMNDTQRIEALVNLLSDVLHALEMTQYAIDDGIESQKVVEQADNFHNQMLQIIHHNEN